MTETDGGAEDRAEHDVGTLDWDGAMGEFWVREQERRDATLAPFNTPLLDAAGVGAGSAVLDVGCGCGATTLDAAGRGADPVVGVDPSSPMLERARELAVGDEAIEFIRGDAQTHPFEPASFDAIISRFGVMFFDDPPAAFANVGAALRPGGRLAFVCWQSARRNPHISLAMREIVTAFPDALPRDTPQPPFSLADPEEVRALLTGAGFADVGFEPIERDVRVGDDPDAALEQYLAGPMPRRLLEPQPAAEVTALTERVRARLAEHARDDGVYLGSAAWLVTAER